MVGRGYRFRIDEVDDELAAPPVREGDLAGGVSRMSGELAPRPPPFFTNSLVLDTGIGATWRTAPHVRHSFFTGGRSMTRKRSAPVKNAARCPGHGTSAKT